MNALENAFLLFIAATGGVAVAAMIIAALAQSWLNRQSQTIRQQVQQEMARELAAARAELEEFAKHLAVRTMTQRKAEPEGRPVDAKTVEAAEHVHAALTGWIKALGTIVTEPAGELISGDGSGAAVKARLERYYEEGRAAFFQARQMASELRTQALYLDEKIYDKLDKVFDSAMDRSRTVYESAKHTREAQDSANLREFQRSFSQLENARNGLAEFCNETVVPLLKETVEPHFRAIRSEYAARTG